MSKISLDDFIIRDPFQKIYSMKRDRDSIYHAYMDYRHYLKHLWITWNRIHEEYTVSMDHHAQTLDLLSSRQENSEKYRLIFKEFERTLGILECDIETFTVFAHRYLDKVAKLVEVLIQLPRGDTPENNFRGHKKYF